jgi:Carboxypeptidase regulatory-like domain
MERLTSLIMGLLLCCLAVLAQSDSAVLSGRVTDASGAVVVGASVSVSNVETGASNQIRTNEAGLYSFSALRPGIYRVAVRASGFRQAVRDGLVLHVQDVIKQDISLEVGSADEIVTVTGEAPLVNAESAAVGTVVNRQFVANLPLNGRSIQSLITLTPGVVVMNVSSGSPGQFSMNGQRPDANYFSGVNPI